MMCVSVSQSPPPHAAHRPSRSQDLIAGLCHGVDAAETAGPDHRRGARRVDVRRAVAAGARLPVAAAADARRGAGAAEAGARGVADARAGAGWLARLAALRAGRVERALAAVS